MEFDIALNGLDAGDVFLDGTNAGGILQLVDGLLETKFEQLVFELGKL